MQVRPTTPRSYLLLEPPSAPLTWLPLRPLTRSPSVLAGLHGLLGASICPMVTAAQAASWDTRLKVSPVSQCPGARPHRVLGGSGLPSGGKDDLWCLQSGWAAWPSSHGPEDPPQ